MGSHNVCTHWMYQYYVLCLAWWCFNEPKHVAEFLILISNICRVYWLNKFTILLQNTTGRLLSKQIPSLMTYFIPPVLCAVPFKDSVILHMQARQINYYSFFQCFTVHFSIQELINTNTCSALDCSPTHCTTRVNTYTCYMYCCHNTGIDRQDFKFRVFFLIFKLFSNFSEVQIYSLMMIC